MSDYDDINIDNLIVKYSHQVKKRSKGPEFRVHITNLGQPYKIKLFVKILLDFGKYLLMSQPRATLQDQIICQDSPRLW